MQPKNCADNFFENRHDLIFLPTKLTVEGQREIHPYPLNTQSYFQCIIFRKAS